MSERSTRFESALEIWLAFQHSGGDRTEFLARHPDLRELLEAFFDDGGADTAGGERILGEFRLGREVGRGGMGVVYEARQLTLDRRVAIKVLAPHLAARPATIVRFRREALHLARLDHPGILRVLDVGEQAGEHWLAMEFIDGQSLDRRLERLREQGGHERDSLRQLVAVVEQIASALQHAHEHGVVHRDIKPSNILLRADGEAVLGDFGLARDDSNPGLTQAGIVAGTPNYMSPEQVTGGSGMVDARSDVFALGTTLYESVTLQLPFDGATTDQILYRIVHQEPADPRRAIPGLPGDLVAIVQKALEKDPARRYQTAGAFADDLRAFLELRPVTARPVSRLMRIRRWVRREPLQATLLSTVLIAGLMGTYLVIQLPQIHAAESNRRKVGYENAVTAGLLARTRGDSASCYGHFHRALELFPGRGEAIAGLCLCIRHFEGSGAGLAELERRTGTSCSDEDVERTRAILLARVRRSAEAEAIQHRLGEPVTPTAMWLTAVTLLDDADDEAALTRANELMSMVIHIAPEPRLLYYEQWAAIESRMDNRAGRKESAEVLLRLWPDDPGALQLAAVNLVRTDPERSVALIQKALDLGLVDPLGRVNLAFALRAAGRQAEAVATAHQALAQPGLRDAATQAINDRARDALIDLLHGYQDSGEGAECETWYREEPHNTMAMRHMAQHLSRSGGHQQALGLFRELHARDPENLDHAMDLALALSFADELRGSVELLRTVVARNPTDERAHELLSGLCGELQDSDAILAELERWAHAKGDDVDAWIALAGVYLLMDDTQAGSRALAAAERADYLKRGCDPAVLELRAQALDKLGSPAEAARLRERAKALASSGKGG